MKGTKSLRKKGSLREQKKGLLGSGKALDKLEQQQTIKKQKKGLLVCM